MNTTAPASLTESVTPIAAGAHVLAAAFPANQAMLALADELEVASSGAAAVVDVGAGQS